MGQIQPDLVIVQGDTTTAMVSALTAYYLHIPVAHLEAGLRTRDIFNPFPEEANRRVISLVSSLHFAPTDQAARALAVENVPHEHVTVTGNTVIDALMHVRNLVSHVPSPIGFIHSSQRVVLLTMHRRESVGQPFEDVCNAVLRLTERNENIDIAFPVHPSPVVREPVTRILGNRPRIHLLEPLDYLEFVQLLDRSYLVLTDSGGVQEGKRRLSVSRYSFFVKPPNAQSRSSSEQHAWWEPILIESSRQQSGWFEMSPFTGTWQRQRIRTGMGRRRKEWWAPCHTFSD